jgi:hypothetical protein
MQIVNEARTAARTASLFAALPNRKDMGITARRPPIAAISRRSSRHPRGVQMSTTNDLYFAGLPIAEALADERWSKLLRVIATTEDIHFVGMTPEESAEYASRLKAAVAAADADQVRA